MCGHEAVQIKVVPSVRRETRHKCDWLRFCDLGACHKAPYPGSKDQIVANRTCNTTLVIPRFNSSSTLVPRHPFHISLKFQLCQKVKYFQKNNNKIKSKSYLTPFIYLSTQLSKFICPEALPSAGVVIFMFGQSDSRISFTSDTPSLSPLGPIQSSWRVRYRLHVYILWRSWMCAPEP